MEKNDVVTLVTIAGEIVGRYKSEEDATVVVENPRLFMQTQEGAGFAPGVCMTGDTTSMVTFQKSTILCVIPSSAEVVKAWQQVTSGIVLS